MEWELFPWAMKKKNCIKTTSFSVIFTHEWYVAISCHLFFISFLIELRFSIRLTFLTWLYQNNVCLVLHYKSNQFELGCELHNNSGYKCCQSQESDHRMYWLYCYGYSSMAWSSRLKLVTQPGESYILRVLLKKKHVCLKLLISASLWVSQGFTIFSAHDF